MPQKKDDILGFVFYEVNLRKFQENEFKEIHSGYLSTPALLQYFN